MRSPSQCPQALRCALLGVLAGAVGLLTLATGAAWAESPVPAPPRIIDGPSSAITALTGMSIARDGTGGLVYLKGDHVYVSQLAGTFQSPQQVDAGLAGGSAQPVIAAANGGFLVIAFINGGSLYVVQRAISSAPYSAPRVIVAGASNPAISVTTLGKVYLAFTAAGDGGHDVRCAYYYNGSWGLEPTSLDAAPADDAGTGAGRPAVAASNDGVGIVAWGEAGHVFTRRVWATSPSVVYEQADAASIGGWNEVSADEPAIATGGDSSYAAVTFREAISNGSEQQSRVLLRRLHGSLYDGVASADGLGTPGAEGADQPQVSVGEYGSGFAVSGRDSSHQLVAMQIRNNDVPRGVERVDSVENTGAPYAVPAAVGYHDAVIAWQENPSIGSPGIRARFFDGQTLQSELPVSPATLGPTNAAAGLVADGDIAADVAIAWVQDDGGAPAIVAEQMYQPPGGVSLAAQFVYARTTAPTVSWDASGERWGALYTVKLDGTVIGQTGGTSLKIPAAQFPRGLGQGRHRYQVHRHQPRRAVEDEPDGDRIRRHGRAQGACEVERHARARLDAAPRMSATAMAPGGTASGVDRVKVTWGDGTSARYGRPAGQSHVYPRAGSYKITVTVTDRAGNRKLATVHVRVARPITRKRVKHG